MRKKRESLPENRDDHLSSRYRAIGIKAVAAAVEPGRKEKAVEEKGSAKRKGKEK